jgi:hypothetical protein
VRRVLIGLAALLALLAVWVGWDLAAPLGGRPSVDLRGFDPGRMAHRETEMWRAYYDRKPLRLYWLLVATLHQEYRLPVWRAATTAPSAVRAALAFQEGHDRLDYERAMPDLERYFDAICRIGRCGAPSRRLARLELEWWVAHREREEDGGAALIGGLAAAAAALYGVDAEEVGAYAQARAAAMLQRDAGAETGGLGDADWDEIEAMLGDAYRILGAALRH